MDVRVIRDPEASGDWNMAVDEALLESSFDSAESTLRFYAWEPATLSLGYFQTARSRQSHSSSSNLPWIRRRTGGGAIIHDREVTYCLVAPVADRFARAEQIVGTVHETLIRTFRNWSLKVTACAHTDHQEPPPFLCFLRRARFDLLLQGAKIGGSAQRRHQHRTLLHGSVLLSQSEFAPELPGVCELAGLTIEKSDFIEAWLDELQHEFQWNMREGDLREQERQQVQQLLQSRYANRDWNERR